MKFFAAIAAVSAIRFDAGASGRADFDPTIEVKGNPQHEHKAGTPIEGNDSYINAHAEYMWNATVPIAGEAPNQNTVDMPIGRAMRPAGF